MLNTVPEYHHGDVRIAQWWQINTCRWKY